MDRRIASAACSVPSPPHHGRFVVSLCTAHFLWLSVAVAQRSPGLFGPVLEHPLAGPPAALLAEKHSAATKEFSVVTLDPPMVATLAVGQDGLVTERTRSPFPIPYASWWGADLDGDGMEDLMGLSPDGDTLAIVRRLPAGGGWEGTRIPLEFRPQRLTAADIDNDGRTDILCSGRNMAGVLILKGTGNGMFVRGDLLFPEISAADIEVAELNGDGIADVLLANWLSNQVALFFGISRGLFSEQLTIDCGGEPSALALGPVSRRRTFSLAVILAEPKAIMIFAGNGAGEFAHRGTIALPASVTDARFLNLNGDPWPDIVATGKRELYTITAMSASGFETPVAYSVGDASGLWLLSDVDADRQADLVCCDRLRRRFLVAGRPLKGSRYPWPLRYLTGSRPAGVLATDLNRDGRVDLLVANSGSASLSFFPNRGEGGFAPPTIIGLAEAPSSLSVVAGDSQKVISTHRKPDLLSVIDFAGGTPDSVYTIPTAPDPLLLRALRMGKSEPLRLLVRARGRSQQSISFSVFEQLSGRQFLERTFEASLPSALRALTIGGIAGRRTPDLVVSSHSRVRGRTILSYAAAGEDFSYGKVVPLVELRDTVNVVQGLLSSDVDGDGVDDIIILPGSGRSGIGIIWARSRASFETEISWIDGLPVQSGRLLTVADLDGDGARDFVVLDQQAGSIRAAFGTGGRSFSPGREIAPAAGCRGFAVGRLREGASLDLILTSEDEGVVSILPGVFNR